MARQRMITAWAIGILFGVGLAAGFIWFYASDELTLQSDYRVINPPSSR